MVLVTCFMTLYRVLKFCNIYWYMVGRLWVINWWGSEVVVACYKETSEELLLPFCNKDILFTFYYLHSFIWNWLVFVFPLSCFLALLPNFEWKFLSSVYSSDFYSEGFWFRSQLENGYHDSSVVSSVPSDNAEIVAYFNLGHGRAMAQAVSRRPVTTEARVRSQVKSMWDLWWTKWHWDRFVSELSVFPCRFHSTGAPLIVKIGKKLLIFIIFIGVAQKALRLWCEGPLSPKKKKLRPQILPSILFPVCYTPISSSFDLTLTYW
jgi:hypothetical protein